MKWSIFVCLLVCLASFCEGGALRCPPGVLDPSCSEDEKKEINLQGSSSEPTEAQCLVGTEWESNCHYCRCSDSGIAECLKQDTCDKGVFAEPVLCKPNTTFQRDCNTCVCLDNGLGLCTLEFCRRSNSIKDTLELSEEAEKESTKKSDKTDVVVPIWLQQEEGNFLEIAPGIRGMLKRATICKPLEEFMRECNPCKCAADGLSFSCTKNECLEQDMDKEVEVFMESEGKDHIERHSVCVARNTFRIGCNTCRCNQLGTDYACTNKPCPLPADVEIFHELKDINHGKPLDDDMEPKKSSTNTTEKKQVCVANRMFVKNCNTCWCNEDGTGYSCTRKVCVPLLPDEQPDLGGIPAEDLHVTKKQCQPDEVFEMDCNMCRCNPDGKSYACTRRACEETDKKEKVTLSRKVRSFTTETPKTCQPGQEFRMDCNKCLCDNRGYDFSCTRIDCNALNNNHHASAFTEARSKREVGPIAVQCAAGSVFERDCNVCRCTADGAHAACTLKRCPTATEPTAPAAQDNELHAPESDPGFRCNPGEQFKRDCNDCTCSADGRSVFCTLRLCDQALAADI